MKKPHSPAGALPSARNQRRGRRRSSWETTGCRKMAVTKRAGSHASRQHGCGSRPVRADEPVLRPGANPATSPTPTPRATGPSTFLCRDCGSRRCACCRPDPRGPASAPGFSLAWASSHPRRRRPPAGRTSSMVCGKDNAARARESGNISQPPGREPPGRHQGLATSSPRRAPAADAQRSSARDCGGR